MPKMNLSQTYTYSGRLYGPGDADVPEAAVKSLTTKEAAYRERLTTHEPPAPVTPAIGAGERHDPRRRALTPAVPQSQPSGPKSAMQYAPATASTADAKTADADKSEAAASEDGGETSRAGRRHR